MTVQSDQTTDITATDDYAVNYSQSNHEPNINSGEDMNVQSECLHPKIEYSAKLSDRWIKKDGYDVIDKHSDCYSFSNDAE